MTIPLKGLRYKYIIQGDNQMTTITNTKEILHYSNVENPFYPSNVKDKLQFKSLDVEIEDITFKEQEGKYEVILTNDGIIEVCGVCGETQPMNDKAMKLYDSSLVEEIETYEWDNNRCEQKHKPFEFDLPVKVEYLEPKGLREEYIKLKDKTDLKDVERLDKITSKIKRLQRKDLMDDFKEFDGFVGKQKVTH